LRTHDDMPASPGRRRGEFHEDDPYKVKIRGELPVWDGDDGLPPAGDRWSTWDDTGVQHGPEPYPDWVITELAAVDNELGVLKTGKEADVHLLSREVPDTDRACLLAAKRYRSNEHRMFHRDAGYLEGRRMRRSRENRAMARRTQFGREVIAGQWASAEFAALCRLWTVGTALGSVAVPYPVSVLGTELLLEFIGDPRTGEGAPRLAQLRPEPAELRRLWTQLVDALVLLARAGLAHGDLSAYNILIREGRLVLIDLPQVVDIVANPQGTAFLARDVANVAKWFGAHGLSDVDADGLTATLMAEAGMR